MGKHKDSQKKKTDEQDTDSPPQEPIELNIDYKDRYLRLLAEFENARKRSERERTEFIKYAKVGVITEFLNILDDLQRAVEAAQNKHQDYDAFLKGVELVMAHIHDMLKKNEVISMDVVGKPFDPHRHEILMQVESDDHEDGVVLEEFQKGFMIGDRVVRTAKVKVAVKRQESEVKEETRTADNPQDDLEPQKEVESNQENKS